MKICPRCNTQNLDESRFCQNCRFDFLQIQPPQRDKNALASFILSLMGLFLSPVLVGIIPSIVAVCISGDRLTKKNNNKKGFHVAALTIGIISIMISISVYFVMTGSNNTSSSATEESKETEKGYIELGESFEVDGKKITFLSSDDNFTDYEDRYNLKAPKEGMKYAMGEFKFENNGNSDEYFSASQFNCYADNTLYDQTFLDNDEHYNGNLSPGRNVTMKVYFEVPIDSQSIELEYDGRFFSDEKVIIKLK